MNPQFRPSESMPPRWAEALLGVMLEPVDRDIVAGDLLEEYREAVLPAKDLFRARIWYCRQVLSFLRVAGSGLGTPASNRIFGTLAAAAIEYALLAYLPQILWSGESLVLLSGLALFSAAIAGGMPGREDASRAGRTIGQFLLLFCVAAGLGARASVYTPVPAVVAFFAAAPLVGFQWARQTGRVGAGSVVACAVGMAMFLAFALLASILHWRHPPFAADPIPPAAAIVLGFAGAAFGKRFQSGNDDEAIQIHILTGH